MSTPSSQGSPPPQYDPLKILAPDSVTSVSDTPDEAEDVIPPTQDVYDGRVEGKAKEVSSSPSERPSGLSGFSGGRPLFGASAPSALSPSFHQEWAQSGKKQAGSNGLDGADPGEEPPQVAKQGTIVLSSDESQNSVEFVGRSNGEAEPGQEKEDTTVNVLIGSHSSSSPTGNMSLRLSQTSDTQNGDEQGVSQSLDNPSGSGEDEEKTMEDPGEEGDPMETGLHEGDSDQGHHSQELGKESDDNEKAGLEIAGGEEGEGALTGSGKPRKKRLSRRQRALLAWEKRKAAKASQGEAEASHSADEDRETPKRTKKGRVEEAPSLQSERRSLRERSSSKKPDRGRESLGQEPRTSRKSKQETDSSSDTPPTQRRVMRQRRNVEPSPPIGRARRQGQRRVAASEQRHSTPKARVQREPVLRKTQSERKPQARKKGGRMGAGASASVAELDPYDIDSDDFDASPAPLRHINVARSFGDIRFSKAPSNQSPTKSKYARLEKSAELRRQSTPLSSSRERALADTQPLDSSSDISLSPPDRYEIVSTVIEEVIKLSPGGSTVLKSTETDRRREVKSASSLTPKQRKLMSPSKSTPSSGNLADVSSLGTKSSSGSGGSYPGSFGRSRSGQSSQHSDDGGRGMKSSSSGENASVSLFSEIEPMSGEGEPGNEEAVMDWEEEETPSASGRRGRKRRNQRDSDSSPALKQRRRRGGGDEGEMLPKRVKPTYTVPELTSEEQLEADHPGPDNPPFPKGARVVAAWKDKNYYPGHIVENEGFGRFKVMFLDEALRDMPQPDIVPLAQLKTGDILMVDNLEAEELQPITLEKCPEKTPDEWFDGMFQVYNQSTEQRETIHWTKLVIDSGQKKAFVSTSVNVAAETVSAGNISGGRERRTRPRTFSPSSSSQSPRRPRKSLNPPPSRPKKRTPAPQVPEDAVPVAQEVETRKTSSSQIFEGMRFVLTSANRRAKSDCGSDSDDERPLILFVKKDVRRMIEDRGGTVIDDFSITDPKDVYLVADTHYRTHKYLSALARAIPCVSHIWIHNCCTSKERHDPKNYMLPAGVSLEREQLIDWHDACPRLLQDMTVMVHTENRPPPNKASLDFVQIWAPLVRCMGAVVVGEVPSGDERLDMLLTDASCTEEFLEEAERLGAFAVSSEWLIQAIITGGRPDPGSHQKYRYDYVEPSSLQSSGESSGPR